MSTPARSAGLTARALTLLALVHALLAAALATRQAEVAWMALPALTCLGAALLRAPRAERLALRATRQVELRREPGRSWAEVVATVWNDGAEAVHLRLADAPPAGAPPQPRPRTVRALLRPGEQRPLRSVLTAPRGRFSWRAVSAVASDPLGLVEVRLELPAEASLRVQPELTRLGPLPLAPRRTFPSPGAIPARTYGSGTDFWGVREYQPGDPLRWLDWRLAARHPGALFTRQFEQERTADVGLVLDAGPLSGASLRGEPLLEHEVRATASLAEALLRQGHRVSLIALGERAEAVLPGFGRIQLQRILSCLAGVAARPAGRFQQLPAPLLRACPARSLLLVVSALDEDPLPLLLRLRRQGRQLVVVSPDPLALHPGGRARDPVGRLAFRAARVERRLGLHRLAQLGIPAVDWHVDEPLQPLLRGALSPARGQGRRA